MHRLKANVPDITVVDGPFAGRSYKAGEVYAEIPPQEAGKFEQVPEPAIAAEDKGGKKK